MGEGTYCANFSPDMEFVDNLRESSIVSSLIGKTCKESFEGSTASMIIFQYTIFNIVIFLIIHGIPKNQFRDQCSTTLPRKSCQVGMICLKEFNPKSNTGFPLKQLPNTAKPITITCIIVCKTQKIQISNQPCYW